MGKGTIVRWPYVEQAQNVFDWSNLDSWVNAAQSNGVSFFYSSDGVPPFAAADPSTCAPAFSGSNILSCTSTVSNIQYWDDFVNALATRYKGKMIYELWNEPNTNNFTGTVSDMVNLCTHEYNDIRAIDPGALVLAPSGGHSYLDKYFAAGGPKGVDVITIHSYFANPEDVLADDTSMQAVMAKYGLSSKPLWNTEGSWGTNSLSTDAQIAFVARYYLLQWSMGLQRFYWYAWDNQAWGTLWDSSNGLRPAATAYQQTNNWMVGATMSQPCSQASNSTWTCGFTRPGSYQALAIWNPSSTTSYSPASQYTQYRDLSGNVVKINGAVQVGPKPILLETNSPGSKIQPPSNLQVVVR
ncbi:MAG: cellulase family glycosylhydrolase [Candidatus Acidiferrales bacterium]